jgi:riboflavin synthase
MFTGIITDIGEVIDHQMSSDGLQLQISTQLDLSASPIGASIACNGVCLTVTDKDPQEQWLGAYVSGETLSKTNFGTLAVGDYLNLEQSLKVGDELGGHIVTGHVDGLAQITDIRADGASTRIDFTTNRALGAFVAPKGSIALNGVSLTINTVDDTASATKFGVNLIPHSLAHTTFGTATIGDGVNLEIDVLARYTARLTARLQEARR